MLATTMTHHDVGLGVVVKLVVHVRVGGLVFTSEDEPPVVTFNLKKELHDVLMGIFYWCVSFVSDEAVLRTRLSRTVLVHIIHVHFLHFRFITESKEHVVGNDGDLFNECELNELFVSLPRAVRLAVVLAALGVRDF